MTDNSLSSLHDEVFQSIQNFVNMNTKEIIDSSISNLAVVHLLINLESFILKITNEEMLLNLRKSYILNYLNNQ